MQPDRDAIMEDVIDKLKTWDDDQIEQHLKELRRRVEAVGDHPGVTAEDIELGCWAEALREFHDSLS